MKCKYKAIVGPSKENVDMGPLKEDLISAGKPCLAVRMRVKRGQDDSVCSQKLIGKVDDRYSIGFKGRLIRISRQGD